MKNISMNEIIKSLRTYHNRGELKKYLNEIADELEKKTWQTIDNSDLSTYPTERGYYKVICQDGKIHEAYCSHYANGWFWSFDIDSEMSFKMNSAGKPKVIKWHPNPQLP